MNTLNIIGKVGAGKSHFIKTHLSRYNPEIFDIKDIYQERGFTPEDIHKNHAYRQFSNAIQYKIGSFLDKMKNSAGLFVIESSGLNTAINNVLKKYPHYTVYITSHFDKTIYDKRPYARNLNSIINNKFVNREIIYDNIFYGEEEKFEFDVNPPYSTYFNFK